MTARALIVDDEPDIRELLAITLGRMQIQVATAADYASAVRHLGAERFDLVLTDMRLPDGDGLDLVEWIQAHRAAILDGSMAKSKLSMRIEQIDDVDPLTAYQDVLPSGQSWSWC